MTAEPPPSWVIDTGLEAERARILAAVHPGRQRVLRVVAHHRAANGAPFDPAAEAVAYVAMLGFAARDVPCFDQVQEDEARRICVQVARYAMPMRDEQMPQATAEAIATVWLSRFGEGTTFLVNGPAARSFGVGPGWGLFELDLEAGVLAVSPVDAGLFWNAENS